MILQILNICILFRKRCISIVGAVNRGGDIEGE